MKVKEISAPSSPPIDIFTNSEVFVNSVIFLITLHTTRPTEKEMTSIPSGRFVQELQEHKLQSTGGSSCSSEESLCSAGLGNASYTILVTASLFIWVASPFNPTNEILVTDAPKF